MDAREPKEVEDARIAVFVKGTKTGEVLNGAMKDLVCFSFNVLELSLILPPDGSQKTRRYIFFQEK